jgi:hypothetical protein
MLKILAAAALAAFTLYVVYDVTGTPGISALVETPAPQRGVKGDRLPVRLPVLDCSQMGWPHSRGNCPENRAQPGDQPLEPREVRIVRVDRLPAPPEMIDECDCHR